MPFYRLLRIDRALFQEWVSSTPAIGMSIMAMLSARLRASDTARRVDSQVGRQLVRQVNRLQSEKEQLLELQRVRQEVPHALAVDVDSLEPASVGRSGTTQATRRFSSRVTTARWIAGCSTIRPSISPGSTR